MTRRMMLSQIDSIELAEWQAWYVIEHEDNLEAAAKARAQANVDASRKRGRRR